MSILVQRINGKLQVIAGQRRLDIEPQMFGETMVSLDGDEVLVVRSPDGTLQVSNAGPQSPDGPRTIQ